MRKEILLAAMVGVTCAFATSAHAVTVTFDATNTSNIPGLTGFMTLGDMMDGLEVTVTFASGGSETRSRADTGFQSGGVAGTGWSLNLTGDTFVEDWEFSSTEFVTGITLNGLNAFTVFDIEPALVNGDVGVVIEIRPLEGRDLAIMEGIDLVRIVMVFDVGADGRIAAIFDQLNPDKLARLPALADLRVTTPG